MRAESLKYAKIGSAIVNPMTSELEVDERLQVGGDELVEHEDGRHSIHVYLYSVYCGLSFFKNSEVTRIILCFGIFVYRYHSN